MDLETFIARCEDYHLEHLRAHLLDSARPAIRLISKKCDEDRIAIGSSKFGGQPDVPSDFIWPEWKDRKLAFIAQLNLAELADMVRNLLLPEKGLLSFFYDPDQETWGFDPNDKGSWRVYFFEDTEIMERRETPHLNSAYGVSKYEACLMSFHPFINYPEPDHEAITSLNLSDSEQAAYEALFLETLPALPLHQLLGYAHVVQNPMEVECQLVNQGVYLGNNKWVHQKNIEQLQKGYDEWRLLLQIDSDDETGWMWGDCGMIYFWIREQSLKNRLFTENWMILQCS